MTQTVLLSHSGSAPTVPAMGLMRLFSRPQRPASFLHGRVGFAVGDIHGRADLLELLLAQLEARAEEERRDHGEPIIVFLGDYVDRGRDSRRVIELLLEGRPFGFERRFLRGNHEQAMRAFMDAPLENRNWVRYGGAETLVSYGVDPPAPIEADPEVWLAAAAALSASLPASHLQFLDDLQRYQVLGDYVFVHAGVDRARPPERQDDRDLYWSRDRFLNSSRPYSHRIVHGHSVVQAPYVDERRIAIDTGAYASGVLTAARFEGVEVSFIATARQGPPAPTPETPVPPPLFAEAAQSS